MAGIEGSTELNDRQRFRGFYRTDATGEFMGPAIAEIARKFNWTQMAVISRGVSAFLMVCDKISHHQSEHSLAPYGFCRLQKIWIPFLGLSNEGLTLV